MRSRSLLLGSLLILIGSSIAHGKPKFESADEKLRWLNHNFAPGRAYSLTKSSEFGGRSIAGRVINDKLKQCLNSESIAFQIERELINPWETAWIAGDAFKFSKLTAKTFKIENWIEKKVKTSTGRIHRMEWSPTAKFGNLSNVQKYLKAFKQIDDVTLDFVSTVGDLENQTTEQSLYVRFDIRGTVKNGTRRNDRGLYEVLVQKLDNQWLIKKIEILAAESVSSAKAGFSEATKMAQLDSVATGLRNEAIRRGGFALAVGDYNNDGYSDIYLGTEKAGHLLAGTKAGTFQEDLNSPIAKEISVKTAIFTDLNNDGWQDMVMVRFNDRKNSIKVYHNHAGRFVESKSNPEPNAFVYAMPAAVGDFNNDGYTDLYVGFPGVKDFTNLSREYQTGSGKPMNGKPHGLYLNDKNANLVSFTSKAFSHLEFEKRYMYPHSAIAVDYDNDGHQDVIVMDDRGGLSPVFRNLGNGKFRQVADRIGISNKGYGMGVAVADFDNDGLVDVAMSNVDFTVDHRIKNGCILSQDFPTWAHFNEGLTLYKNMGDGKFADVTAKSGIGWVGQGAGGVEFIDYDNDGFQDIYVVNGLWSGTTRHEDLASYFVRASLVGLSWDRPDLDYGRSAFMHILSSRSGGVLTDKVGTRLSMAGFQRNRLFRNNGDGTFTEAGYLEGVDSIADGYVVAKADLNGDGHMDLILRNADPGTAEYMFPTVQLFMNQGLEGHNSLKVYLSGVRSSREGIGAKVIARLGDKRMIQEMIANNGAAQSQRVIHFGMGKAGKVDLLEVIWPSGMKSQIKDVPAGSITVVEPTQMREARVN